MKTILFLLSIITIAGLIWWLFRPQSPAVPPGTISIKTPSGTINAEVANTPEKQELGLGQRSSLPPNSGMLFPFDHVGTYPFWMKDMKFPLDIVWVDSAKRIIGIVHGLATTTFPNTVAPNLPIQYVLEISAGRSDFFKLATGTQLIF